MIVLVFLTFVVWPPALIVCGAIILAGVLRHSPDTVEAGCWAMGICLLWFLICYGLLWVLL